MELNDIQKRILAEVADLTDLPQGAVNIRSDGKSLYRTGSENVRIESKQDRDGMDIYIAPGAVGESVHIPVVLTAAGFQETVYNDFFIGEGAEVTIVAGCGIHNCGCDLSQHDGVHTFHVGKNAQVKYIEKHYGEGDDTARRVLNPETVLYLAQGARVELESAQIRGVDDTRRLTRATVGPGAQLIVRENLLTHGAQRAESVMDVTLEGEDSRAELVSRSVAQERSYQRFDANITGAARCFGHVTCDAIIMDEAKVDAVPCLSCHHVDASLVHEAAIGKIAGEQLLKLETLGLTPEQAEQAILKGFLR